MSANKGEELLIALIKEHPKNKFQYKFEYKGPWDCSFDIRTNSREVDEKLPRYAGLFDGMIDVFGFKSFSMISLFLTVFYSHCRQERSFNGAEMEYLVSLLPPAFIFDDPELGGGKPRVKLEYAEEALEIMSKVVYQLEKIHAPEVIVDRTFTHLARSKVFERIRSYCETKLIKEETLY